MLKYKTLIKIFVLECVFVCCVNGDTVQTEEVMCLLVCISTSRLIPFIVATILSQRIT